MRSAMLVAVGACLGLLAGALIWSRARAERNPSREAGATAPAHSDARVSPLPPVPPHFDPPREAGPPSAPHLPPWFEDAEKELELQREQDRIGQARPYDPTATAAWKEGFRPAFDESVSTDKVNEVRARTFVHKMAVTVLGPQGPLRGQRVQVEYVLMYMPAPSPDISAGVA